MQWGRSLAHKPCSCQLVLHEQCLIGTCVCMNGVAPSAGRFGFQKEMNALQSLSTGNKEEAFNVTALLRSTHEVETRVQEIYRYLSMLSTSASHGAGRFRGFAFEVLQENSVTWNLSVGGSAAARMSARQCCARQSIPGHCFAHARQWLLHRWWKLWKRDVREGWEILGRYRVGCTHSLALQDNEILPQRSLVCLPCKWHHVLLIVLGE